MLAALAAVCFGVDFVLELPGVGGNRHVEQLLLYGGLALLVLHLAWPINVRRN